MDETQSTSRGLHDVLGRSLEHARHMPDRLGSDPLPRCFSAGVR
jgi:hypothetical protein